ncbi:MAG: hypothetical protein GY804_09665 [Alphaproteobacteria bacterium]|nr:hypothetical protein [Alphaproteobacteria bacterium]
MREIKFRAWDKYRKRFCDWEEATAITMEDAQMRIGIIELHNGDDSEYVFQQFTGLKDKNGKEIYEGDKIRHPEYGNEGVIKCEDWLEFYAEETKEGEVEFADLVRDLYRLESFEVICNIYEDKK